MLILLAFTGIFGDNPDDFSLILQSYQTPLISCWFLATIVVFIEKFLTHRNTLSRDLTAKAFARKPRNPPSKTAVPDNVVVYGGFSPFVGSGYDLTGWSFTVNLERAKPDFGETGPEPFEIDELYKALRKGFERLDIDGLSILDRLFVDGRSIREDRRFLPTKFSRPVTRVSPAIVEEYRSQRSRTVRHYLCLVISDWSGEIVLSTFIRAQKSASKLFIETSYFLLPPLKRQYYDLDKHVYARPISQTFGWILQSAVAAPILGVIAPFTLWNTLTHHSERSDRRLQKREIEDDPLYNYGARQSVRELGTANSWRAYFQKLDKEMHSKVVQQQLLDVLVEFLDLHGIDTSEIKDRGSHILNNGVIVSGGTISAESLAVGEGAQAKVAKGRGHTPNQTT